MLETLTASQPGLHGGTSELGLQELVGPGGECLEEQGQKVLLSKGSPKLFEPRGPGVDQISRTSATEPSDDEVGNAGGDSSDWAAQLIGIASSRALYNADLDEGKTPDLSSEQSANATDRGQIKDKETDESSYGKLDFITYLSAPQVMQETMSAELVLTNSFVSSAMASNIAGYMQDPQSPMNLAKALGVELELPPMSSSDQITPYEFLKEIGIDPHKAIAVLERLQSNLAHGKIGEDRRYLSIKRTHMANEENKTPRSGDGLSLDLSQSDSSKWRLPAQDYLDDHQSSANLFAHQNEQASTKIVRATVAGNHNPESHSSIDLSREIRASESETLRNIGGEEGEPSNLDNGHYHGMKYPQAFIGGEEKYFANFKDFGSTPNEAVRADLGASIYDTIRGLFDAKGGRALAELKDSSGQNIAISLEIVDGNAEVKIITHSKEIEESLRQSLGELKQFFNGYDANKSSFEVIYSSAEEFMDLMDKNFSESSYQEPFEGGDDQLDTNLFSKVPTNPGIGVREYRSVPQYSHKIQVAA